MFEFTEADVQAWEAKVARLWTAWVAGERDPDVLARVLEADDEARATLVETLFRAATTGDAEALWIFGRAAIAGCGGDVDPEQGWFLVESAAEDGWEPAAELLRRRGGSGA